MTSLSSERISMPAPEDRITSNPGIRRGKPIIHGTRMTVLDVLEYMAGGMTHDEILDDFPDLERDDLLAVLAFAADRERRLAGAPTAAAVIHRDDGLTIHPEILGGTPVFTGSRVPVESLVQHLAEGDSLDDFLDAFPGVSREQASGFLHRAYDAAIQSLRG